MYNIAQFCNLLKELTLGSAGVSYHTDVDVAS